MEDKIAGNEQEDIPSSKISLSIKVDKLQSHFTRNKLRYKVYGSALVLYLVSSLLLPVLFDAYRNLPSRFYLFLASLVPLTILVRWDNNRIVIGFSFLLLNLMTVIHTICFPSFYSIITPFFPVFLEYLPFISAISEYETSGKVLLRIIQFGYFYDLIIVLTIAGLLSLTYKSLNKLLKSTGRRRILELFGFGLLLAVILVIPYLIILSAGTLHFGLAYSSGAVQLQQGFQSISQSSDLHRAYPFFVESLIQYALAEDLFEGLGKLHLFYLLQVVDSNLDPVLANGKLLVNSSFRMVKLFLPFIEGMILIEEGFDDIILSELGNTILEKITNKIGTAADKFTNAQSPLIESLKLINRVDLREFTDELKDRGIGDYHKELQIPDMVLDYLIGP